MRRHKAGGPVDAEDLKAVQVRQPIPFTTALPMRASCLWRASKRLACCDNATCQCCAISRGVLGPTCCACFRCAEPSCDCIDFTDVPAGDVRRAAEKRQGLVTSTVKCAEQCARRRCPARCAKLASPLTTPEALRQRPRRQGMQGSWIGWPCRDCRHCRPTHGAAKAAARKLNAQRMIYVEEPEAPGLSILLKRRAQTRR